MRFPLGQRNANNITGYVESDKSYINFDRLYNNIVAEQKKIEKGTELKPDSNGILHITIGGCYNIKNIANVREIIFDNFEDNKNKLTIITIDDSGDINFPLLSKSGNGYKGIVTNDYYGKEKATHFYERDTFLSRDSYHGNIVWNLPNATYIKLKEDAPFAGHLVAPNADVETPELHFAGSFIVNSIYGEGNTEAHFYPLIVNEECACEEYHQMSDAQKRRFYDYRLSKSLGGEGSTVQMAVMGNQTAYAEEKDHFELALRLCNGINDASASGNPGTRDAIIMSVIAAAVSSQDNLNGEVINIGPDEEFVTINELAREIAEILNFDLNPIYVKDRPKEIKEATCSSDKARRLLGYKTQTSLRKGLEAMVEDIKQKGPKDFRYNYKLEITNKNTPDTWKKKII